MWRCLWLLCFRLLYWDVSTCRKTSLFRQKTKPTLGHKMQTNEQGLWIYHRKRSLFERIPNTNGVEAETSQEKKPWSQTLVNQHQKHCTSQTHVCCPTRTYSTTFATGLVPSIIRHLVDWYDKTWTTASNITFHAESIKRPGWGSLFVYWMCVHLFEKARPCKKASVNPCSWLEMALQTCKHASLAHTWDHAELWIKSVLRPSMSC